MTETDPLRAAADTMHEVRDRCVWTQQIDHRALVPYLVEESAELIDAVETGSRAELREELGDLLWQVLFHAEIASRDPDDPFDIDDVARGLTEKMVRRHPHVFAGGGRRDPRAGARAVERRQGRREARAHQCAGRRLGADAVARARAEAARQGGTGRRRAAEAGDSGRDRGRRLPVSAATPCLETATRAPRPSSATRCSALVAACSPQRVGCRAGAPRAASRAGRRDPQPRERT